MRLRYLSGMASPAPSASARWLTRANALTALRLLITPFMAWCIVREYEGLAHGLFWLAVATDLLDGRVARRYGEVSPLGGLIDHATDATFVATGLFAVAAAGHVPMLLPPLVLAAFLQYTLDSKALAGQTLRASSLGRWNGIAYFVLVGIPVVNHGLDLGWPPQSWTIAIGWALVATTLFSMGNRLVALLRRPQTP